jgi:DNA-binding NarL/FixJ family response regulator
MQVCGEAENGEDAIALVQRENPNALILDVLVPKMNGLDAARKISAISPKTGVVLFTSYACEHLLGEAASLGIRSVVTKDETGALLHLLAVLKEATGASCAA